jgi:uncharacterized membrane protein YdjX (TVP38/TMEM64 family)
MLSFRGGAAALAVAAGLLCCAAVAWIERERLAEAAEKVHDWSQAREWGIAGVAAILGIYLAIALMGLPVSWFTAVVGFLWGAWSAVAIASVGTTAGAMLAFGVGRWVFAPRVGAWIARKPRMSALARAVGESGFKIVVLTRLSPLSPFGATSYAFSVMPIRPLPFLLGTALGKIPGNVFYAFLGAGAHSLVGAISGDAPIPPWQWVILGFGIVATGALLWLLTRMAKRALTQAGVQ